MTLTEVLVPVLGDVGRPLREEDGPETVKGWDSVKHLEIIVALEDAYRIELSTAEILRLKSIQDMLAVLRGRGLAVALIPE